MSNQLSKIEVFIIARIKALKKLGWSIQAIADALGVDPGFVESVIQINI